MSWKEPKDRSRSTNTTKPTLWTLLFVLGMAAITFPIILLFVFCIIGFLCEGHASHDECYPASNPSLPQYIVGYGSLMNNRSKLSTDPTAGASIPVRINGFQRIWDAQGDSISKYFVTYLGIRPESDSNTSLNAVIFRIYPVHVHPNPIGAYDHREDWYCRRRVGADQLQILTPVTSERADLRNGEVWIYVTQPSHSALPDATHPIRRSYVDTFVSGCFEIEDAFKLDRFAQECVESTAEWGKHWYNNRQPTEDSTVLTMRERIDTLLRIGVDGWSDIRFSSGTGVKTSHLIWSLAIFYVIANLCKC